MTTESSYTETQTQFWRDEEQEWVNHVLIRRDDKPNKWRHRIITITRETGDWQSGRRKR